MKNLSELKTLVNEYAVENYKAGLNCAESVFDALIRSGALSVPPETVAVCTGLGGGIGLTGHTCGALLAAVLANGATHGRKDPWAVEPAERRAELSARHYRRYNRMVHEFDQKNQGVNCAAICAPYDDWNSRDRRIKCLKLIAATAVMALEYLDLTQEEAFDLPYGANLGGLDRPKG